MLEEQLAEKIIEQKSQAWLAENREAIDAYNVRIQQRGVFSDRLRRF
jgi:antitoxin CcdA